MHALRKLATLSAVRALAAIQKDQRDFARAYERMNFIDGWLESPRQERWLYHAARAQPDEANIVEVGSFKGRSTACLALGCLGSRRQVYAIDLFDGSQRPSREEYFETFLANMRRCGIQQYITPVMGNSVQIGQTWSRPINLLFIDGGHDYASVCADFRNFSRLVVPGGLIAFHDVSSGSPDVLRFWIEVAAPALQDTGRCGSIAYGTKASPAADVH